MAHLAWAKGGTADIVAIADDAIEVRSTTSAPPGARLDAQTVGEPQVAVKIKSHGSRKDADGTFLLKGRLLDANRELRDRLAALVVPKE